MANEFASMLAANEGGETPMTDEECDEMLDRIRAMDLPDVKV